MVGHIICSLAFLKNSKGIYKTYAGRNIGIPRYFLLFPSYFLVGTLIITWMTYIIGYMGRNYNSPLTLANGIVLPFFTLFCGIYFIFSKYLQGTIKEKKEVKGERKGERKVETRGGKLSFGEIAYLFFIVFISVFLMWYSFFILNNKAYVGYTVYSDFSPHLSMIRSFSKGNNFPTTYTFFAGQDIRYHFMFFFLVGNLEFLGLPLDFALNIPSALGLISVYLLLYVLAVKITGKKEAGFLTGLFFTFRSSSSLFIYLAKRPRGVSIFKALTENTEFIGFTPREEWGLWNLNVYINQRHFPFSLALLLFILILVLPKLYEMIDSFTKLGKEKNFTRKNKRKKVYLFCKRLFFTKEGWLVKDYKTSIIIGIIAGAMAFWNGASLIALLSILFLLAICSTSRLEFLIIAILASGLSFLQSSIFVKGYPVSPKYYFGFIVENPNLFSLILYLLKLLGILPIILLILFVIKKGVSRYLTFAFLGPLILTFTLSLTPDVTVNHKYMMISIMLIGILLADFIVDLYKKKEWIYKWLSIFLILLLTITGIYDLATLIRKNQSRIELDVDHKVSSWIMENATSKDCFLTAPYALNQITFSGPSLYLGWPYFSWSAGYNTKEREIKVKEMYEASTPEELEGLVLENGIRFIIIDNENRKSKDYQVNEETISSTYQCVYQEGIGQDSLSIYDTRIPIWRK